MFIFILFICCGGRGTRKQFAAHAFFCEVYELHISITVQQPTTLSPMEKTTTMLAQKIHSLPPNTSIKEIKWGMKLEESIRGTQKKNIEIAPAMVAAHTFTVAAAVAAHREIYAAALRSHKNFPAVVGAHKNISPVAQTANLFATFDICNCL